MDIAHLARSMPNLLLKIFPPRRCQTLSAPHHLINDQARPVVEEVGLHAKPYNRDVARSESDELSRDGLRLAWGPLTKMLLHFGGEKR